MIPVAAQEEAVIQKVNSAIMCNFTAFVRFPVAYAIFSPLDARKDYQEKE